MRNINLLAATNHVLPIATVIEQKIREIGNPARIYMFGISLGSHIAIAAARQSASKAGKINRLELCDTAKLSFFNNPYLENPMAAAKSVSCIHSSKLGLSDMKCHQNFRLGLCGYEQNFDIPFNRMNSHVICQVLYIRAFTKNMKLNLPNEMKHQCMTNETLPIADLNSPACRGVKFGYLANFDKQKCRGNFFVETDDVIKEKEVLAYLKRKETRFDIADWTLFLENSWNRLLLTRGSKSFPYK